MDEGAEEDEYKSCAVLNKKVVTMPKRSGLVGRTLRRKMGLARLVSSRGEAS